MNRVNLDIYGYPLLDNLHQLFPEILYDTTLFPHDERDGVGRMLSWVRYRMAHLYPQTFTRARQEYAQSMAHERRNDYDEWMWLRNMRSPVSNQRPVSMFPVIPVPTTNFWGGEDQPMTETPIIRGSSALNQVIQNTIIDEIFGSLLVDRRAAGFLRFYDPVPIVPTAAEIAAGSRVMTSSAMASDAICAICQDHESPQESVPVSNGWRQLVNCQHIFHRDCIDRWFEGHVLCPVCRADIRTVPTQQTPSNRSEAGSQVANGLSSPDSDTM